MRASTRQPAGICGAVLSITLMVIACGNSDGESGSDGAEQGGLRVAESTGGGPSSGGSPSGPANTGGSSTGGSPDAGADSDAQSDADVLPPPHPMVEKYAKTYCESIEACCQESGNYLGAENCIARSITYLSTFLPSLLEHPTITVDDDAVEACLEAVRASNEACTDQDLEDAIRPVCTSFIVPDVPIGGACVHRRQCIVGRNMLPRCDSGVCTAKVAEGIDRGHYRRKLGESCNFNCVADRGDTGSVCMAVDTSVQDDEPEDACWTEDGVVCSNRVCVAAPSEGESCIAGRCDPSARCEMGTCVALSPAGTACSSSAICALGTVCDDATGSTKTCEPQLPNGAACPSREDKRCLGGVCFKETCADWSVANWNGGRCLEFDEYTGLNIYDDIAR